LQALIATLAAALCLAWSTAGAYAAARVLPGQVTRVVDGDTLWFQPDELGEPLVAVRLRGIDAPETCQAWGRQATAALREQAQGRPATLRTHGQDDYRRTLGTLSVGGVDVNAALVAQGHAWAWRDVYGRSPYLQQEAAARSSLAGVHADAAAETPWDFRQRHGRCRKLSRPSANAPCAALWPTSPAPSATRSRRWATAPH
jgi:endonuclease YncB( thermonuclease family)